MALATHRDSPHSAQIPEIPDPQRLPTRALYCCRQRGLGGGDRVGDGVLLVPGGSCWSLGVQESPVGSRGSPPAPSVLAAPQVIGHLITFLVDAAAVDALLAHGQHDGCKGRGTR